MIQDKIYKPCTEISPEILRHQGLCRDLVNEGPSLPRGSEHQEPARARYCGEKFHRLFKKTIQGRFLLVPADWWLMSAQKHLGFSPFAVLGAVVYLNVVLDISYPSHVLILMHLRFWPSRPPWQNSFIQRGQRISFYCELGWRENGRKSRLKTSGWI